MNTIKSKIITITLSIFFILITVFSIFAYLYYRDTKTLMIEYASKNIASEVSKINKEVIKIEKNAKDLALLGEIYYKTGKNKVQAEQNIIKIFENYPESLGGGIWFKPYIVNPQKKYDCIYAYRNKENNVVIDKSFESSNYNYFDRSWHKEILPNVIKDDNIEWSLPYYEKEGSDSLMITAGSGIYDNNEIVGISTVDWAIDSVVKSVSSIRPTENSFTLFANPTHDYIIVSSDPYLDNSVLLGKSLDNLPWYNSNLVNKTYITYHKKKYIPYVKTLDNGMVITVCIPKWELFHLIFKSVAILCIMLGLISFGLATMLYRGLHDNIIKPIGKLIFIANKISQGNNDVEIKVENPEEFAKLASTFNKMTKDIKNITSEREKINSELSIAKSIQLSSLPDKFPAFPERNDFDIFATMVAAKEVGGDFYDFYFTDDDHLMFLIADVSGKGIPAALFMMTAKTLINNMALNISDPKEFIEQVNKKICTNNKHGLFITMFAGIVDMNSGEMTCINCGHNPPLIRKNNGQYEYITLNSNIVLGISENADFQISRIKLDKGDVIFAYTDGVTEAINSNEDMYGENRLLNCLNKNSDRSINQLTEVVKEDIKLFSDKVEQSDDITMLVFKYGQKDFLDKKIFKCYATQENYKSFYTWLHKTCEEWGLTEEYIYKLDMCAEEIYANIQFYAYGEGIGTIEVILDKADNELIMEYKDFGVEYNPLEKEDPDINLPPNERPVGGLGIFMLKQLADDIRYERRDNQNILTLIFKLNA